MEVGSIGQTIHIYVFNDVIIDYYLGNNLKSKSKSKLKMIEYEPKVSQLAPVWVGGHVHWNDEPVAWHVPPFKHGLGSQGLNSLGITF